MTPDSYLNSPQWNGSHFQNTLPRKDGSLSSILKKMIFKKSRFTKALPNQKDLVIDLSTHNFGTPEKNGLHFSWLGHSTVLIEIDGFRLLTDPVWSERVSPVSFAGPKRFLPTPLPLEKLPQLDAVLISHDHFDHLDKQTILRLQNKTHHFITALGVGSYLRKWGIDSTKITELDWWQSTEIQGIQFTATPARHFSGRTSLQGNQTLWAGWAIASSDHRVFFSGDSAFFPEFAEIGEKLGPFDLTLLETGAYDALWVDVHMGPEQAVLAHRLLKGKFLLPVHWGTFDLATHNWTEPAERLLEASQKHRVSVLTPRLGQWVCVDRLADSLQPFPKWWPEIPWQKASEEPIVSNFIPDSLLQEI